ncbi:mechanosensitive ion channel protein 1, mitochondrial [Mercurialis annua]|uniref:mechanosensitive ion channel protein 1, mitochondrial n=1 Tax=Mercurialis annua TaxID=3986 RepID=UPI0021605D1E|nr:mechanosensitive ion channel protein 1, mitochondrial [Mercurialis annua]
MARVRFSMLKSLTSSINSASKMESLSLYYKPTKFANQSFVRPTYALLNQDYCKNKLRSAEISVVSQFCKANSACPTLSRTLSFRSAVPFSSVSSMLSYRSFSWSSGGEVDKSGDVSASIRSNIDAGNSVGDGIDWIHKAKETGQSAVDAITSFGEKTKEISDELIPYGQQFLDSQPYLKNVIVPVSCTCFGSILAWVVMPRILRKFHKYFMQSPAVLPSGSISEEPVPYERSFWGALEAPVRYLVTFMAFLEIGKLVAPTTIPSQYIAQGWRGAVVLSFIWFLYRWKTNVFGRALGAQSLSLVEKERLLTLDKVSSVSLFVIGLLTFAEACGVAVQSILTVGGIGGVATAFASKDILGNVLSGFSMQFSKPFSLGDTIKAGSIEGQVVEMGLTTTMLLNAEKFPVIVPNSLFSSQVIVNKSRAQWRAMITTIPVSFEDLDKMPQITTDIKSMLKLNPKVFLGKEAPYCYLSRIESSSAELTIGCNLRFMSKDELYSTEQDILLQSVRILKEHGASLGSTWQDYTTR